MKRYDYMQKTYEEIRQYSEDASLTQLMQCFLMLCTGNNKDLINNINEVMQRYDKSLKLYNLIGLGMLSKGQTDKAVKMYAKLVGDLDLKDTDKCNKYIGNTDVTDLLHNYLIALRWSEDITSPQIAETEKILKSLTGNDQSAAIQEFEDKFTEACNKVFGS